MVFQKQMIAALAVLILSLNGCGEQGLNPDTYQEPGFSGAMNFTGRIPPPDSLIDVRIVAVPYYPVDSTFAELFDKIVTKGIIPFSENMKEKVLPSSTVEYLFSVKPQIYYYVAVVQQYGPNPLQHWKVVGVYGYSPSHPHPVPVTVVDGVMTDGIDFTIDFYNVPIQPFKVP